MSVLLIAEYDNNLLKPALLNTLTAAQQLAEVVDILLVGDDCQAVAESAAKMAGIRKVRVADAAAYKHYLAEELAVLIAGVATDYTHILASASAFSKNFMPRLAALLDVAQLSDIIEVIGQDTFVRPMYAGNVLATVKLLDAIKVLTVRSSAFAAAKQQTESATIEKLTVDYQLVDKSQFIKQAISILEHPDLEDAKIVVSGGRGLSSAEQFQLLEKLANCLGAAIGASRAAVDAGFAPNDWQVGQTGKTVSPDLYIAIGISGAVQHLAGMKDSKIIVAINKDENAPIFEIATYGLVGDLFTIVPDLINELEKL